MATEEFIPKNNTSPEGHYQRSVNIQEYILTRGEAVDLIANLAKALALPGGHHGSFSVHEHGVETCRVLLILMEKDLDPSLKY